MRQSRMWWVTLSLGIATLGWLAVQPHLSAAISRTFAGNEPDSGGGGCSNSVVEVIEFSYVGCIECNKGSTSYAWSEAMPAWVCSQLCSMGLQNLPPSCSCY